MEMKSQPTMEKTDLPIVIRGKLTPKIEEKGLRYYGKQSTMRVGLILLALYGLSIFSAFQSYSLFIHDRTKLLSVILFSSPQVYVLLIFAIYAFLMIWYIPHVQCKTLERVHGDHLDVEYTFGQDELTVRSSGSQTQSTITLCYAEITRCRMNKYQIFLRKKGFKYHINRLEFMPEDEQRMLDALRMYCGLR